MLSAGRCLYCLQYIVPSVTETGPEIVEDTFRWVGAFEACWTLVLGLQRRSTFQATLRCAQPPAAADPALPHLAPLAFPACRTNIFPMFYLAKYAVSSGGVPSGGRGRGECERGGVSVV
jgi:hypothetical protein